MILVTSMSCPVQACSPELLVYANTDTYRESITLFHRPLFKVDRSEPDYGLMFEETECVGG